MDERSIILKALKTPLSKIKTPSEDIGFSKDDAISRLVKKKKRQERYKTKSCLQWGNLEFLQYLDSMLKDYGVIRHVSSTCRDLDQVNNLYDLLVKKIGSKMNNLVLREYMEWWCSIKAPRLTGSGMWLSHMIKQQPISRFSSRFVQQDIKDSERYISNKEIYDAGGLSMLLTKRGIVVSYRMMESLNKNPSQEIQETLERFQESTLSKTIKSTISNSPYNCSSIDFVSIVRPYLLKYGLKEFANLDYKKYFSHA